MELKPKEEAFCRAYAEKYNGTKAALIAGYGKAKDGTQNEKSAAQAATRLLKKEEIKHRVEELLSNSANEAGATTLYIAQQLKEVVDRCMQDIKPEMAWNGETRELEETGFYTFNARDAVGALKVLADIQGMSRETKVLDFASPVSIVNDIPRGGANGG